MLYLNRGNERGNGDVKGENFLTVANHPAMTYRTTGIRRDGEVIIADGELTIKGITRPVELAVEGNGFGPDPHARTPAPLSPPPRIHPPHRRPPPHPPPPPPRPPP